MKNFIIILLLSIVVFIHLYQPIEEGFTPGLRRMYRPYLRHTRVTTESFFTDKSTVLSNMFRRTGIL